MKDQKLKPPTNLDWLIIGGGIHGVHIAAKLIGAANVAPGKLRIVDPGDHLLSRWLSSTETTGMTHLRSPSVHHLDLNPWSLQNFAGKRKRRKPGLFAPPYDRPSLPLFNAHCQKVIKTFNLSDLHIQERAIQCDLNSNPIIVKLSSGDEIKTTNIVLAMGAGAHTHWPDWAPRENDRVHHIFEPGFNGLPTSKETVAVIGGGISAAQVALRLSKEGHDVHLVSRHALRQHQFDSDPGWLGPKYMTKFERESCHVRRRAMISEARHRGSVPPDVRRALRHALAQDELSWHESEVHDIQVDGSGVEIELTTDTKFQADRALLATGFESHRPGGAMIDSMIESATLPCAPCGYPIVDSALRWHSHVYVSGPLAELELGPSARNIAGARRAGDRILAAVQKNKKKLKKAS